MLALKKEDSEISFPERIKLAYHLLYCDPCRNFIKQSELINNACKDADDALFVDPPFTLEEEQIQKIREQLSSLD